MFETWSEFVPLEIKRTMKKDLHYQKIQVNKMTTYSYVFE